MNLRKEAHNGTKEIQLDPKIAHLADCMMEEVYQAMKTNQFANVATNQFER